MPRQHLVVMEEIDNLLGATLVNRIDEIVIFDRLNEQNIIMLLERAIICWKTVQILNIHGSQWALFKGTLTPAVAALLAAILTYFVQSALNGQKPIVVLCACSAVYGISYAAALWTLRLVEPDEIDMVKSTVTKFRSRLPF